MKNKPTDRHLVKGADRLIKEKESLAKRKSLSLLTRKSKKKLKKRLQDCKAVVRKKVLLTVVRKEKV